ncbi:OLC1v1011569C1 [Oldenlandia corymbosa var. corymbosa]|uniref:OLC1v1011569C1 n=1 Tax=Oldenlandia corymbosa var. corymbosa TaxID=529605 RepID=A0AAV1DTX0_OLDCO|nr:OLC1v1011569C1 [Oldenlandia corymbosa var. corymbosa]
MGELRNWEASAGLIEPKVEVQDTNFESEEHDRLPLKQRLKILLARSKLSDLFPGGDSENDELFDLFPKADYGVVKKRDGEGDSEYFSPRSSLLEGKSGSWSSGQHYNGEWGDCDDEMMEADVVNPSTDLLDKVKVMDDASDSRPIMSSQSRGMDGMSPGNSSLTAVENDPCGGSFHGKETVEQKSTAFVDEFDHIVLKERQRLLLSSQICGLTQTSLECKRKQLPAPAVENLCHPSTKTIKVEVFFDDKEFAMGENRGCGDERTSVSGSSNAFGTVPRLDKTSSSSEYYCHESGQVKSRNMTRIEEMDGLSSLQKNVAGVRTVSRQKLLHMPNLSMSNFVGVKVEPIDINETNIREVSLTSLPVEKVNLLKVECGNPYDFEKDILDHMLLRERMKLLPSYVPCLDVHQLECTGKIVPSAIDCEPIAKESLKPLKINRLKKRKTATASVERALEEDAPGLLQVLIGKGVSVDEIKLYGQPEHDDALDDLLSEDNFTELEAIISKIFSQPASLLKLSTLRCSKGEKASYCLACLFSLVEQAQHLRFRKWPVEWGWCRDLQAFIFVFARHNRIVLERPEYGYATYFFELMDTLPINWQITRLVTVMKLTNCSRATLLENKALVVGEDLTEGEAKVLAEYGWTPNTGLGNMLNYCDRVVHDRKAENPAEWRSKIGKLLVDGYNSGCIVAPDVPKKVVEYGFSKNSHIKMELN